MSQQKSNQLSLLTATPLRRGDSGIDSPTFPSFDSSPLTGLTKSLKKVQDLPITTKEFSVPFNEAAAGNTSEIDEENLLNVKLLLEHDRDWKKQTQEDSGDDEDVFDGKVVSGFPDINRRPWRFQSKPIFIPDKSKLNTDVMTVSTPHPYTTCPEVHAKFPGFDEKPSMDLMYECMMKLSLQARPTDDEVDFPVNHVRRNGDFWDSGFDPILSPLPLY